MLRKMIVILLMVSTFTLAGCDGQTHITETTIKENTKKEIAQINADSNRKVHPF
jgi:uncharacterized lipoprotein NlpE involved in copper resistance